MAFDKGCFDKRNYSTPCRTNDDNSTGLQASRQWLKTYVHVYIRMYNKTKSTYASEQDVAKPVDIIKSYYLIIINEPNLTQPGWKPEVFLTRYQYCYSVLSCCLSWYYIGNITVRPFPNICLHDDVMTTY